MRLCVNTLFIFTIICLLLKLAFVYTSIELTDKTVTFLIPVNGDENRNTTFLLIKTDEVVSVKAFSTIAMLVETSRCIRWKTFEMHQVLSSETSKVGRLYLIKHLLISEETVGLFYLMKAYVETCFPSLYSTWVCLLC